MILQMYFDVLKIVMVSGVLLCVCEDFGGIVYKITQKISIVFFIGYILYSVFSLIYTLKWYFIVITLLTIMYVVGVFMASKNKKDRKKYDKIINITAWVGFCWVISNVGVYIFIL